MAVRHHDWPGPPLVGGFSAFRTAALNIANGAGQEVIWDTEEIDVPGGWFNPANGRFTPQLPGYYDLAWSVWVGVPNLRGVWSYLAKNGVAAKYGSASWNGSGALNSVGSVGSVQLIEANGSTDYFSIFGVHSDPSARAMNVGAVSHFTGRLVHPK